MVASGCFVVVVAETKCIGSVEKALAHSLSRWRPLAIACICKSLLLKRRLSLRPPYLWLKRTLALGSISSIAYFGKWYTFRDMWHVFTSFLATDDVYLFANDGETALFSVCLGFRILLPFQEAIRVGENAHRTD